MSKTVWLCVAVIIGLAIADVAHASERFRPQPQARRPIALTLENDGPLRWLEVVNQASATRSRIALGLESGPRVVSEQPLADVNTSGLPQPLVALHPSGDFAVSADPFSGDIHIWKVANGERQIVGHFEIEAHNIRGLTWTLDGQSLLLAHQILYPEITTTQSGVHWGAVLSNVVRTIPTSQIDEVVSAGTQDEPTQLVGMLDYLGSPDEAAGDPGAIVVGKKGRWILFSGTGEVVYSENGIQYWNRLRVGKRPVALTLDEENDRLYVADQFNDAITVLDPVKLEVLETIALGPEREPTSIERGEALFYNARLSRDGWYSCHSCHTDGHTNGLQSANFPENFHDLEGDYGYNIDLASPSRQVPTLLGVADSGPWGWGGQFDKLEDQVRKSLQVTMQGSKITEQHVKDLTAYIETLRVPEPLVAKNDPAAIEGRAVFERLNCADCHSGSAFTSAGVYDVGVHEKNGRKEFNPPSLLGAGHRRAFLHDGRAKSIEEAVRLHQSESAKAISPEEMAVLVTYLKSL